MSQAAKAEAILVALPPRRSPLRDSLAQLAGAFVGRSVYLLDARSRVATAAEAALGATVIAVPTGLASAIGHCIERGNADRLAVVDGRVLRHAAPTAELVEALFASLRGGHDFAVAASPASPCGSWTGGAVRWLAAQLVRRRGVTEPLAGCFALRRSVWQAALSQLDAGDRTFLLDLLAASPGTRVGEVPAAGAAAGAVPTLATGWEVIVSALNYVLPLRVPRRWLSFAGVGALGTVTDVAVTALGLGLGLRFGWARTGGVLIGMVQNYLLNNALTFAADGRPATLRGLAFYGACQALGTGANWGLSMASFAVGAPWFVALVIGVVAGNTLNFLTASRLVWPVHATGAGIARGR